MITSIADSYVGTSGLDIFKYSIFFFRFAKKFSITNQDFGPFYNGHGDQITNKREISQLLLEQFSSVFSTPSNDKKVTNPDLFFLDNENETQLDDIIINDDHIISDAKRVRHVKTNAEINFSF